MDLTYEKQLRIRYDVDVLVCGGGPSGVAAAVSAARMGSRVLLVEQSGTFGGASMLCGVPELMNFDDGLHFLSQGFGKKIFQGLGLQQQEKRQWHNLRPELLKRLYDQLVLEAGVRPLLYTRLVDCVSREGKLEYVVLSGPEGIFAACAKVYVDATGSGSLCALAGAEFAYGDEAGNTMSATLCSLWGGVNFAEKDTDGANYEQAFADGVFSQYDSVLPGIKANFPEIGVGGGNIGHCFGVCDIDGESMTYATLQARHTLAEYQRYYKEYVSGCENSCLIRSADYLGIRESRRICCEYMLNRDDFYRRESFFDEIGRYSYPVDIHPMQADKKGMADFSEAIRMRHADGESYSIPYRCLIPKYLSNVLVAGRALGADRAMQASIRVIPACYITGQAAGAAAALSAHKCCATKELDIPALHNALKLLCDES